MKRLSVIQGKRDPGAAREVPSLATSARIARGVGAIALLVVGGVHFEQYTVGHFSVIPTIGPLFLLNFISATILGLVLLVPMRAAVGFRRLAIDSLAAISGVGLAVVAFVFLVISEHTPLFAFMEHGYRVEIVIALVAEAVTAVSLGIFLWSAQRRLRRLRRRGARSGRSLARPPATAA
jgi:CBS domain containing-hemolysin-like protein